MKQTTYTRYLDRTIARQVDEQTAAQVEEFIDKYRLNNMVFLQAGSKRYYPHGTLACHVLGFTTSDGGGAYGLELQYDSLLSGTSGRYITARDSHGNEMPYEYQSYIRASDGHSIVTTLDVYVQSVLEEQLSTAYIESGGQSRACGIVIDVETGGILGSVVPMLSGRVLAALQLLCKARILTVGPGLKSGIKLRLDNPAQLGAELPVSYTHLTLPTNSLV